MSGSKTVLYAALAGNVAIAVTKFVAAAFTGSSSMLAEAIHSLVDSGNQLLLLYGMKRAKKAPDAQHPLGYGRELYFWSFVVAVLIFSIGAGVSFYEGVVHIRDPEPSTNYLISMIVLALAFLFEGSSWYVAMREFGRQKGDRGWWEAFRRSKDPGTFVALFEDSAALAGIVVAAIFISLAHVLEMPVLDGVGSILIGIILAVVAFVLAQESKALLIGEAAEPDFRRKMVDAVEKEKGVVGVGEIITMHMAPDQIVVMISLDFDDDMRAGEVEQMAGRIEKTVAESYSEVHRLFIRPQSDARTRPSGPGTKG